MNHMDDSPNGFMASQKVPIICWDMESPQTTKGTPRSVVLPPLKASKNVSPADSYLIEQWGSGYRNKRRLKRPPKPNLYKRHCSPEKDEFEDDLTDEVISQMSLTPLLNKHQSPGPSAVSPGNQPNMISPVNRAKPNVLSTPKNPTSAKSRQRSDRQTIFKTPTIFKTYSYKSDQQKVMPRKLTVEFDEPPAQSTKHCNPKNVKNSSAAHASKQPIKTDDYDDFDDGIWGDSDDDELVRQADLFLASQEAATQSAKCLLTSAHRQQSSTTNQQTSCAAPTTDQKTKSPDQKTKSPDQKTKSPDQKKRSIDDDFFDDSFLDDDVIMGLEIPARDEYKTPPRTDTPQRKKQKFGLSLNKKKC